MTGEDLRRLMAALEERVRLEEPGSRRVVFEEPTRDELVEEGHPAEGVEQLLSAPWWREMVEDVVETPAFCSGDERPERVLAYARDVVAETLRKRFRI
jgi:hypothetical protein